MIQPADILKASILIVDDQAANISLLKQMLSRAGYTSVTATMDPREVCTLYRQHHHDLILLDLEMPGLDGFAVMEGLKQVETGGYLPVLVITALPEHKVRALQAGARDFVSKPLDLTEVLLRVHNMLEVRLLHRAEKLHNAERLEQSQHIAGIGDWEYNFATERLLWSDEVYRILGHTPRGFPPDAENFYRQVHPDDLTFVRQEKKAAAEGVRRVDFEHRIIRPDGEVRYIHQIITILRDDQGRPVRESGTLQDITPRKIAEVTLRQSEERFAGAFEQAPSGIALVAPDGRWLKVNRALCDLLGYTEAELLGRTFQDITHPEDLSVDLEQVRRLLAGETRSYQMEKRYILAQGGLATVLLNVSLVRDGSGRPSYFISHIQDITARREGMEALRESNERFHQLADNITDAFWIRSPDQSKVYYLSPAFERIWGRTVESVMANPQYWSDFILAEDRPRVSAAFARLSGDAPILDIEYRIVRPTGEIRWVQVRGSQVRNPTDQTVRHIGIVTDITEHKQVDEHLLQAQKMEALGQFSGGVAHDFNNILAAISGYTELARIQLQGNPAVREHLDAVTKAANRAADLVRQILTFSRQQPQTRELLPLQPVVVESMKLMRATIPTTVEIAAVIAADAPTVLANANQVHQVLMNLAINGWHALNNHPGRLQVKLEKVEVDAADAAAKPGLRPGTYARLSVSDNGCGMDQATLRRVFDPFFTTKPPGEGTGLGLAVVHGIMESHDGAVTVHSQPGEGTVFQLYFPKRVGEAAASPGEAAATPRGQGECVLVVDDEEMLAHLSENLLSRLGYTTECTTSTAAAIELVRANPERFALVLTDQTMPGMTGLQLASQLRDIRPELPIMLTTGYNLSLTADRMEASGVRNILHKPFTLHSLGTAVHATLTDTTFHDHGSNSPY